MGKFTEIKIQVAKTDNGSILYNTENGLVLLLEEDSAYHEFHKYFGRALEKVELSHEKALHEHGVMQQRGLFVSFARFVANYKQSYSVAYEDMFEEWIKKINK